MSDIHGMSNSMTLSRKMSCQPHVPILDIFSIRILGRFFSRWSVLPCRLFRLQGHFSENCACRRDHHSVRRSFHESFFVKGHHLKLDKPWAMTGLLSYTTSHDLLRPMGVVAMTVSIDNWHCLLANQRFSSSWRLTQIDNVSWNKFDLKQSKHTFLW